MTNNTQLIALDERQRRSSNTATIVAIDIANDKTMRLGENHDHSEKRLVRTGIMSVNATVLKPHEACMTHASSREDTVRSMSDRNDPQASTQKTFIYRPPQDLFGPLISLVIFGYYGFVSSTTQDTTDDTGATVALWVAFLWGMRVLTLLFAASSLLAFIRWPLGEMVYGVSGLIAALTLAALGIWDMTDTTYQLAVQPLLMWIVVVWNAYASISILRQARRAP